MLKISSRLKKIRISWSSKINMKINKYEIFKKNNL